MSTIARAANHWLVGMWAPPSLQDCILRLFLYKSRKGERLEVEVECAPLAKSKQDYIVLLLPLKLATLVIIQVGGLTSYSLHFSM